MLIYPNIDPVLLQLGPLKIHWYGLMYLLGFAGGWWLLRLQANRPNSGWTQEWVDELLFYVAFGVIVGGRVGYILFYNFAAFLDNPLILIQVWRGGMSFHGGVLGVTVAMGLFARRFDKSFWQVADLVAPVVTVGLGCGRIGNFINGELWGRPTSVPWGMVFPQVDALPRHPTQLYEATLEGLVLWAILWWYIRKPQPVMTVTGLFLLLYGSFRFGVEFVREPDAHIGFLAGQWLTMGQLLSLPMIVGGVGLWLWGWTMHNRRKPQAHDL